MRFLDGPDEVHKVTVARKILKGYKPVDVPTEHVPTRRAAAQKKFAEYQDWKARNRARRALGLTLLPRPAGV
jgi:acyl-CoA dehydrogenase